MIAATRFRQSFEALLSTFISSIEKSSVTQTNSITVEYAAGDSGWRELATHIHPTHGDDQRQVKFCLAGLEFPFFDAQF
jgi:hypothetical protein